MEKLLGKFKCQWQTYWKLERFFRFVKVKKKVEKMNRKRKQSFKISGYIVHAKKKSKIKDPKKD